MKSVLEHIRPEDVFGWFEKICAIPHGSGNTKQISDFCAEAAQKLGLRYRQDAMNNVIIWKDASKGCEHAPTLILQGHIDMVCARTEDCPKDMALEGLDLLTDGEWVWADRTSLGADNGIAVAMMLAVLSDETLIHPALEAVFTVDEEVGLTGAAALDCSDLQGRQLLNLDSEDEGIFTVSCAGGVRMDCDFPAEQTGLLPEYTGYNVQISGLQGGHSGMDIQKERASANTLLVRVIGVAIEEFPELRVSYLQGGIFDNVICSQAEAKVAVRLDDVRNFEVFLQKWEKILKNEYAASEKNLTLKFQEIQCVTALDAEDSKRILRALSVMPQGVQAMSVDFPGLPQSSLNFGVLSTDSTDVHASFLIRSSIASQKEMLARKVALLTGFGGGTSSRSSEYPGWQYQKQSALRERVLAAWQDLYGNAGKVNATHGGLECGIFIEKIPGLDAVSFGPEMHDVHSVRERLNIVSTERVYRFLCEVLKRSAEE